MSKFSSNQFSSNHGATMVETLAIVAAVVVLGVFLVRTFLAFKDFRQADRRILLVAGMQQGAQEPDSYADINGKLYPVATRESIIKGRVLKTKTILSQNLGSNAPFVIGAVFNCTTGSVCDLIASYCEDTGATCDPDPRITGALRTNVLQYAADLSSVNEFSGSAAGRVQIEVQAPVINTGAAPYPVILDAIVKGQMRKGGIKWTPATSSSSAP